MQPPTATHQGRKNITWRMTVIVVLTSSAAAAMGLWILADEGWEVTTCAVTGETSSMIGELSKAVSSLWTAGSYRE